MNRGKPLQRKTPLRTRAPLHSGPWPSRSKPIKPKRTTARRRARDDEDHGMAWADVRLIIYTRAGGCCELCGKALNIVNMEGHHRRSRRFGPDCPCNALALCGDCHHGPKVHGGPTPAKVLGTIVQRHVQRPGEVPVRLPRLGWVELTCGGTTISCAAPPGDDASAA